MRRVAAEVGMALMHALECLGFRHFAAVVDVRTRGHVAAECALERHALAAVAQQVPQRCLRGVLGHHSRRAIVQVALVGRHLQRDRRRRRVGERERRAAADTLCLGVPHHHPSQRVQQRMERLGSMRAGTRNALGLLDVRIDFGGRADDMVSFTP